MKVSLSAVTVTADAHGGGDLIRLRIGFMLCKVCVYVGGCDNYLPLNAAVTSESLQTPLSGFAVPGIEFGRLWKKRN